MKELRWRDLTPDIRWLTKEEEEKVDEAILQVREAFKGENITVGYAIYHNKQHVLVWVPLREIDSYNQKIQQLDVNCPFPILAVENLERMTDMTYWIEEEKKFSCNIS